MSDLFYIIIVSKGFILVSLFIQKNFLKNIIKNLKRFEIFRI